jgi:tetratricopeptide (TPR) repeat protein
MASPGAKPLLLSLRPGDATLPFALLVRWLEAAARCAEPAWPQLPVWACQALSRLWPALGPPEAGEPSAGRLVQAFHALARIHGTVFIDDLQHADAASLEVLPALLEGLHAAVLAARTGQLPAAVARWAERSGSEGRSAVQTLRLEPWQAQTTAVFLQSAGWSGALAAQWAERLHRHTGGQPIAVLETLRAVLLAQAGGSELPEPPPALPVSPRLRAVQQLRLQALTPEALRITDVAALAGPLFSPELAVAALQVTPQALDAPWRELQAAALMDADGRWPDSLLEAARIAVATPWQRELHRRIAGAAQERGAAPAALAQQWAAGGQAARAAACFEAAAIEAAGLSRMGEQEACLRQAAEQWLAAGDGLRAFEARARRAEICVRGTQVEQGLAEARELLALADPALPRQRAQALRVLSLGLSMQMAYGPARESARQACAAARDLGEADWRSESALLWAMAAASLGDVDDAGAALVEVAAVKPAPEAWRAQLTWAAMTANVYTLLGRLDEALAHQREALLIAQRPESATERVAVLNNLAALLLRKGGSEAEALARAEESLALAARLGLAESSAGFGARLHVALLSQALGRYGRAIEAFEACLAQAVRSQLGPMVFTVENHFAWLWIQLGQPERAAQLLAADASAHHSARVRRWTLCFDLHILCDRPAPCDPPPDIRNDTSPAVAAYLQLALLCRQPEAERAAVLPALLHQLQAQGLPAFARKARVLALTGRAGPADRDARRPALIELHDELLRGEPCAGYGPEAAWRVGGALRELGETRRAEALVAHAVQGLTLALEQVPPALQRRFREGNVVNRALLRAASRLPSPGH